MDFFSGLEWVGFNHFENLNIWKDKTFADYWVLDYAHSGALDLILDEKPGLRLEGPVAWLTFPGPRFQFGRRDDGVWDHYFAAFRGPRVKNYLQSGLFPADLNPPCRLIRDSVRFREGFMLLLSELDKPDRNSARCAYLLEGLLLQFCDEGRQLPEPDLRTQSIRVLVETIRANPARSMKFDLEARRWGMSIPHFRRLFLRETGLPPQRFLLKNRLDHAARLLRTTDIEIKTLARDCGFEDLFHFSKLFRKYQGQPPGRYRAGSRLL